MSSCWFHGLMVKTICFECFFARLDAHLSWRNYAVWRPESLPSIANYFANFARRELNRRKQRSEITRTGMVISNENPTKTGALKTALKLLSPFSPLPPVQPVLGSGFWPGEQLHHIRVGNHDVRVPLQGVEVMVRESLANFGRSEQQVRFFHDGINHCGG